MIGTAVSRYMIVGRLGGGGMAVVYEAQDLRLPRRIALKFLQDELAADDLALARFKREAAALSLLNHPNICTIHDVDEFNGQPFIAMEKLEGRTLRVRLTEGPLLPLELIDIAIQMTRALKAAHEKGVVHRDIKPGNVFLTPHGVKVLDFGLAKLFAVEPATTEEHTADGRPVGTASYMSPERILQSDLDPRSDLFSLGVVLFEMAAGFTPFKGDTVAETVNNVFDKDPPSLHEAAPDQPAELDSIVQKLLARDPSARYQTAGALLRDLKSLAIRIEAQGGAPPVGSAATAVRTSEISVVVMPTKVLADESDLFLADAIPNAICKHLLRVPGIETKRPPTTGDLERVAGDLDQIAAVYGASAYVVSLANISDAQLSLSVQLVDTRSRSLRWCDEYAAPREAYGSIMKTAAEGIRRALQPYDDPMRTPSSLGLGPEVELLLQRGLYYLNLFRNLGRVGDFARAAESLKRVTEVEPERADATAALALLHSVRFTTGAPPAEVVPECEGWVRRTLALDPRNSTAWAILCELETMRAELRKPFEYGLKAAAFGPRDAFAHARLAGCLMWHSYELSLLAASEGARLDPLVLDAPVFAAISMNQLNRRDEALAMIGSVLEIEPDMVLAQFIKGLILADAGETQPALDIMVNLESIAAKGRLLPQWPQIFKDVAAYQDAMKKQDADALDRLTARLASFSRGENQFPRWELTTSGITRLLARRSPDLALDLFAARALMGIIEPYDYLMVHPDLDPLRDDVRFRRLLVTSRRNFDETVAIVRAAHSRAEAPDYIVDSFDEIGRRFHLSAPIA